MPYAIVIDRAVVAVVAQEPIAVAIPQDFDVTQGWSFDAERGFTAPPPEPPWELKTLSGHEVEAFKVDGKLALPAGLDATVVDRTRVLVRTPEGYIEIQNGDVLVRLRPDASAETSAALKLKRGETLRLQYDDAAARLT